MLNKNMIDIRKNYNQIFLTYKDLDTLKLSLKRILDLYKEHDPETGVELPFEHKGRLLQLERNISDLQQDVINFLGTPEQNYNDGELANYIGSDDGIDGLAKEKYDEYIAHETLAENLYNLVSDDYKITTVISSLESKFFQLEQKLINENTFEPYRVSKVDNRSIDKNTPLNKFENGDFVDLDQSWHRLDTRIKKNESYDIITPNTNNVDILYEVSIHTTRHRNGNKRSQYLHFFMHGFNSSVDDIISIESMDDFRGILETHKSQEKTNIGCYITFGLNDKEIEQAILDMIDDKSLKSYTGYEFAFDSLPLPTEKNYKKLSLDPELISDIFNTYYNENLTFFIKPYGTAVIPKNDNSFYIRRNQTNNEDNEFDNLKNKELFQNANINSNGIYPPHRGIQNDVFKYGYFDSNIATRLDTNKDILGNGIDNKNINAKKSLFTTNNDNGDMKSKVYIFNKKEHVYSGVKPTISTIILNNNTIEEVSTYADEELSKPSILLKNNSDQNDYIVDSVDPIKEKIGKEYRLHNNKLIQNTKDEILHSPYPYLDELQDLERTGTPEDHIWDDLESNNWVNPFMMDIYGLNNIYSRLRKRVYTEKNKDPLDKVAELFFYVSGNNPDATNHDYLRSYKDNTVRINNVDVPYWEINDNDPKTLKGKLIVSDGFDKSKYELRCSNINVKVINPYTDEYIGSAYGWTFVVNPTMLDTSEDGDDTTDIEFSSVSGDVTSLILKLQIVAVMEARRITTEYPYYESIETVEKEYIIYCKYTPNENN